MRAVALAAGILVIPLFGASVAANAKVDGNELLARAAKLNRWPSAYSVPLHFTVHLHRPLPIRFGAAATMYYKAPDQQALVVTSLSRSASRLFSRNYSKLDTIPQAWPGKYHVTSVEHVDHGGAPAYRLDSLPTYQGDITHVTFDLLETGLVPVGATWYYRDGSTVRLAVTNQRVGAYVLPQHEELSVEMPKYRLDAECDTGHYDLDAPIPDDAFAE
jgi:hypothetical protein